MVASFVLGMAYGIGGTAFGISIRYIGFSLTYAIAVGLSSVLGTLIPPLAKPGLARFLVWLEGLFTGGAVDGKRLPSRRACLKSWPNRGRLGPGRHRHRYGGDRAVRHRRPAQGTGPPQVRTKQSEFSLAKGLLLSLLAGVLSAVYGFSLEAGEPIADVATRYGADVYRGNVVYIFSNTGAFVTTAIYCLYLHCRHGTLGELVELPAGPEEARLPMNFAMAALTGLLWYMQFFFYNLGHVRMGEYKFTSWAIHMIMLVLASNLIAILFREWKGCRLSTWTTVGLALSVLVAAILALTYGNYLGGLSI